MVATLTLAIAFITGAVIVPTIKHIKELNRGTYELRLYLEKKHERTRNLRSSLKQIAEIKKETADYGRHLFRSGNELYLITTLENIANKNSVAQRINGSNLDNITANRLTMSFSLTGNYANILAYLNDLESLPYFINTTRVFIAPGAERNGAANQTVLNLDISLYVSPR